MECRYQKIVSEKLWVQDPWDKEMNAVLGIAGEAGEIADLYKKAMFHKPGVDIDKEEAIDELGDLLFYVALLAEVYGLSLQELAQRNIRKLQKRWPGRYEDVPVSVITL